MFKFFIPLALCGLVISPSKSFGQNALTRNESYFVTKKEYSFPSFDAAIFSGAVVKAVTDEFPLGGNVFVSVRPHCDSEEFPFALSFIYNRDDLEPIAFQDAQALRKSSGIRCRNAEAIAFRTEEKMLSEELKQDVVFHAQLQVALFEDWIRANDGLKVGENVSRDDPGFRRAAELPAQIRRTSPHFLKAVSQCNEINLSIEKKIAKYKKFETKYKEILEEGLAAEEFPSKQFRRFRCMPWLDGSYENLYSRIAID